MVSINHFAPVPLILRQVETLQPAQSGIAAQGNGLVSHTLNLTQDFIWIRYHAAGTPVEFHRQIILGCNTDVIQQVGGQAVLGRQL